MDDIDTMVDALNMAEGKERKGYSTDERRVSGELIGVVEHYYDKIYVIAIKLSGRLRVGDTIEIVGSGSSVKQRIESMQIDRKDVDEASENDSVGIKVNYPVCAGSEVFKI